MNELQATGIEYEIVELEGDDGAEPKGPARPRRVIPTEIACLSGDLFDKVPRVEIPLDSFFPPPVSGAASTVEGLAAPRAPRAEDLLPPPAHAPYDSLFPVEADAAPATERAPGRHDARTAAVVRWSAVITAAAVGAMVATVLARPAPRPAPQAAAPAPVALSMVDDLNTAPSAPASAPAAPAPAATESAPAAATPKSAPRAKTVIAASARTAPAAPAPAPEPTMDIAPSAPPPPDPLHRPEPVQGVPPQRAAIAIAAAARGAASCLGADDLRRTMAVSVTFAPSGRVTRATIDGGPHRGTAAGSCVAQRLRAATVAPFEGTPVTFHTSITVR